MSLLAIQSLGIDNTFRYGSLESRQIRLLQVSQSDTAPHGLHLNLTKANLDQVPEFAALSYTWDKLHEIGSSQDDNYGPEVFGKAKPFEQTYKVRCGDAFLEVRENLFHFLQWLCTCNQIGAFWVDALCINQEDLDERSRQVILMGDIYKRASKVYVWLGETPISDGAMRIIHDFIPAIMKNLALRREHGTQFYSGRDMLCNDNDLIESIGLDACEIWRSYWRDFIRIFERRWFSRGWIVQEVCIRNLMGCTFVAGQQEIDYRQLDDFDRFLVRTGWTQQLYRKTVDLNFANARGGMGSFSNLRDILSALAYKNEHNLQALRIIYGAQADDDQQQWYAAYTEVINRVRWRGLKDPRDVIYACLGMMATVAPRNMPINIHPDYYLTVEKVYTLFAALLVQVHPFINILSAREDSSERQHHDLPSWVPDFSLGISHNALIRVSDFYRDQLGQSYIFGRDFNASKSNIDSLGLREIQEETLVLQGALLMTVDWCGPDDKLLTALHAAKLAAEEETHPSAQDSMYNAVWRTLIVDDPPPPLNRLDCPEYFRNWLQEQLAQIWGSEQQSSAEHLLQRQEIDSLLTKVEDGGRLTRQHFPTLTEVINTSRDSDHHLSTIDESFYTAYKVAMRGRILYTTSQGHLGLAPRSTRHDDEAWILDGVKVPMILRRRPDGVMHELIGETYVHGCMYGEAMTAETRARFGPVSIV